MGGEDSGITSTPRVFLESAFFAPDAIAGRARVATVSARCRAPLRAWRRPGACARAYRTATRLVLEICGGEAGPDRAVATDALPARAPVRRVRRARRVLGIALC